MLVSIPSQVAVVFNAYSTSQQVWNGSAYVNWNDSNQNSYAISATQQASSGIWQATLPDTTYRFRARRISDGKVVWDEVISPPAALQGSFLVTTTVVDDDSNPVVGARVKFRSLLDRESETDGSGIAVIGLESGTYTRIVTKEGYASAVSSLTLTGTASSTVTLTAITSPPVDVDADKVLVQGSTRDGKGDLIPNSPVEFELQSSEVVAAFPKTRFVSRSNDLGYLNEVLVRSSVYKARVSGGQWILFETPDTGTYNLPTLIRGGGVCSNH